MKLTYYSNVINGKLQKNISELIAKELEHFEGKRVEINIQKLKSTRSSRQNAYWWLIITILAKEIGYTKDELHEIMKYKFLKRERVDENSGEIFPYLSSTTKLNKTEFSDLTNQLIRWASETFNVILPMPEEQTKLNYDSE